VKKMKWLGVGGAALALSAVGLVSTSSGANAGTPTITAGPGSSVSCVITGVAKLSPTLANDWSQAAHSSDPGDANPIGGPSSTITGNATVKAAMASIPDTTYSAGTVPVTTSAKVSSTSCSGTVTDGTNTDTVASAAITTASTSAGTSEATCSGLASPGTSTFTTIIKWKGTVDKINPTTAVSSLSDLADSHGVGFELKADGTGGTSISGSFGGGSSDSKAYIDPATLGALLGAPSTSAAQTGSLCEATLSGKFTPAAAGASDAVAIKLKKPKGLKAITIQNSGPQGLGTPADSTISFTG
jgi:hypothetical protein